MMLQLHDYSQQFFGHAIQSILPHSDGRTYTMVGWGAGLEAGQFIGLEEHSAEAIYQIGQVVYDPPSGKALAHWTAEVVDAYEEISALRAEGVGLEIIPALNLNPLLEVRTPSPVVLPDADSVAVPLAALADAAPVLEPA